MDIFGFPNVDNYGHSCFWNRQGHGLCLTETSPGTLLRELGWFHVIGQLNEEESKISIAPFASPVVDHSGEQGPVFDVISGIVFALVPDDSLNREIQQRIDHTVEQQ